MFRVTLTLNEQLVWTGLFDTKPDNGSIIDRWRDEDKRSSTFDKINIVELKT